MACPMIFLSAVLLVKAAPAPPLLGLTNLTKLTFDANGLFKVVSLSDLHYGEREASGAWAAWSEEHDTLTQKAHATIFDAEKPNFVVFNGDLVTGENLLPDNATAYLDRVYAPTVQRKIPFASSLGNHDNANNINHQQIVEYEQQAYGDKGSYTRADVGPDKFGSANYWVPVYGNKGDAAPALILWIFDSRFFTTGSGNGAGSLPDGADYYWVDENTVPAYIKQQTDLMKISWTKVPPGLVFVHVPFQKTQPLAGLNGAGKHDDDGGLSTQGYKGSDYTSNDLATLQALGNLNANAGQILAVTSGHDHGSSWCARSKDSFGIPLCLNGHSGHGGYVTANTNLRNGRVFTVRLSEMIAAFPSTETYNVYEDGSVAEQVTLNADFFGTQV